ncbi:MAG: 2,3-bisphosphoglycerate-independent phosphoglycerate mutase, partial [Flavobacteriales bacterium]|nr:2,3-bisphosphoglycerate-independent phosphoglycerate mutase [Flavobacteriales bacterium]
MKNNPTPQRCALLILDGWGIGQNDASNAIASAKTPFMDELISTSPNATLRTDGEHVGLPEGQMGNSEVGHMNIGAGRIVYQDLLRINRAVISGDLGHEKVLREALEIAKKPGKRLHFMGLVSQGGVHSQQAHLHELCRIAADAKVQDFVIHAFTDGRDTAPQTGRGYIADLEDVLAETGGRIASVHGRYFAMDRDQRWPRISQSFAALVRAEGVAYPTADEGIAAQYKAGVTDEFI